MNRKKFTAEQIIAKLSEVDAGQARDVSVAHVCRKTGVTEQTYYRWHNEYGGLRVDQAKKFGDLKRENGRFKRVVADHTFHRHPQERVLGRIHCA